MALIIHLSCLYNNCHVAIFAETMGHGRDEEAEQVLVDIIANGGDVMSYLNETDGLEGEGEAGYYYRTTEEEGHDYDGSGDLMPVQDGGSEDGSGDPMPVHEGDGDDVSGDRTESGEVYILVKLLLTS